jgi:iron complex outermembrane receptor protein
MTEPIRAVFLSCADRMSRVSAGDTHAPELQTLGDSMAGRRKGDSAARVTLAACATVLMVAVATGQTPPPMPPDEASLAEVIITGSRIAVPGFESISPVTSVTDEDIKLSGLTRIEDLLNAMPQVFASQGATVSNNANGIAEVDLRGLGSQRTLVLIDGRRLMPGDPGGSNAADLNEIPSSLVQRVDVMTGGSSSVYGADAVAGAVNFVMDTHFEGVKLEASYAFDSHHNDNSVASVVQDSGIALPDTSVRTGQTKDVTFVFGTRTPDQNGNAVFYAGYRDIAAVLQGSYDYSSCVLNGGTAYSCGGSPASFPAAFVNPNDTTNGGNGYIIGPGNVLRPFNPLKDFYNFGPLNYYQRPDQRRTAGAFLHYQFNPRADAYSEIMYMKDTTVSQIAPSGDFFQLANINCSDPALSPSELAYICNGSGAVRSANDTAQTYVLRRNVEGGGRRSDLGHESLRAVLGVRGEFLSAWRYDAYAQYGSTTLASVQENYFSISRLSNALDSANGVTCVSGPPCVPYNIFQLNSVTPQALAYLQIPALAHGRVEESIADASATGDLGKVGVRLPHSRDGLYINIGAEYRSENMTYVPDAASQSGDLSGYSGAIPQVAGHFHVTEGFVEAKMPLVEDASWAQTLAAETGYRYSRYTTGATTGTYKFGLEWLPVSDVRLRGSFQHAVRAPNIFELYDPQVVNPDGSIDVCAGAANPLTGLVPSGATPAQCARMDVSAAQYGHIAPNTAGNYNGLQGGNPQVRPEASNTVSFGIVLTPSVAPGLNVSVDYFRIGIKDVISTIGADLVQTECLQTGAAYLCNLVHRDASGSLWRSTAGYVIDTALNTGSLKTSGIDVVTNYQFGMGQFGRITLKLIGTYLEALKTEPLPGLGTYDCAGYFGAVCGGTEIGAAVAPRWRHQSRMTWATPVEGLSASLAWRFFDALRNEGYSANRALNAPVSPTDARISSRSYFDVSGDYQFAKCCSLLLGVNNVLDKDPPLVGSEIGGLQWNGNTFPQVYDALGRYVFVNVSARL